MFGTVRKHSQALWIPIIIVIVISFVVYFTPGFDPFESQGSTQSEVLVDQTTKIGEAELAFARDQVLFQQALIMAQQLRGFQTDLITRQSIASQFPPQDLDRDGEPDVSGLDYQAHLHLLRLRKAKSVGIVLSDNMVKARLEQLFSPDGKFSRQDYNNFLDLYRGKGFLQKGPPGEAQLHELIRTQIALQLLDQIMTRSVGFFSDGIAANQLTEKNKKYNAQVVLFSTSNRVSEVTNYTTTSTNFINYYQSVADEYFVQPKRKIAHVLFSVTNYLEEAKNKSKFEELVAERRNKHNTSTNKFDHFTDASGTNKLTGTKLDDALFNAVIKSIDENTLPQAKDKATKFRRKLFEGKPKSQWTITRLRTEAKKEKLNVHTTVVSQTNEESALPQDLVDALYAQPDKAAGMLSTTAVEVSGKGYFVFGLEEVIPGRPRQYQELSKGEQLKIKEDFDKKEAERLASEEAKDWRDTVRELMAEGSSFSDSTRLSKHQIISLPAMTLTEQDVNATELKDLITINEIQRAISDLERENRSVDKPNWLSSYITTSTAGVGGFIVYVSKVEKGDAPQPEELGAFANQQRQMVRSFNESTNPMASRLGIMPAWLRQDINILNNQLIVNSLTDRLKNISYESEQAKSEISELQELIAKAKNNPEVLPDSVTMEGLVSDLNEAKSKLQQLEELKSTLPAKLRELQ